MLHFDLTGNAAVTANAISRDVEMRLRSDPTIIFDLRTNNGFNGTKFNTFWDELEAYFNEQVKFCAYLSNAFLILKIV